MCVFLSNSYQKVAQDPESQQRLFVSPLRDFDDAHSVAVDRKSVFRSVSSLHFAFGNRLSHAYLLAPITTYCYRAVTHGVHPTLSPSAHRLSLSLSPAGALIHHPTDLRKLKKTSNTCLCMQSVCLIFYITHVLRSYITFPASGEDPCSH
ncbi:uncharacterized protein BKA78DRAFT_324061 [Phyllosticta capitalensis]|uniref:uncharacterized protein n=1 Tax=Phyllosticta capitalensis TaxID=121624 RepID=UPI00312F95A8